MKLGLDNKKKAYYYRMETTKGCYMDKGGQAMKFFTDRHKLYSLLSVLSFLLVYGALGAWEQGSLTGKGLCLEGIVYGCMGWIFARRSRKARKRCRILCLYQHFAVISPSSQKKAYIPPGQSSVPAYTRPAPVKAHN